MTGQLMAVPKLLNDWRLAGCGNACREVRAIQIGLLSPIKLITHDPAAHEDYGRVLGLALNPGASLGVVRTGGIGVDHDRLVVTVDGEDCHATPTEVRILVLLSAQFNRTFTTNEIMHAVWGGAFAQGERAPSYWASPHMLRTFVSRIRGRLGRWRHLLVTTQGIGYGLRAEEPTNA